jgi:hypothetical protein
MWCLIYMNNRLGDKDRWQIRRELSGVIRMLEVTSGLNCNESIMLIPW